MNKVALRYLFIVLLFGSMFAILVVGDDGEIKIKQTQVVWYPYIEGFKPVLRLKVIDNEVGYVVDWEVDKGDLWTLFIGHLSEMGNAIMLLIGIYMAIQKLRKHKFK